MSSSSRSQSAKSGGGNHQQSQSQSVNGSKRKNSSLDASDKSRSEQVKSGRLQKISKTTESPIIRDTVREINLEDDDILVFRKKSFSSTQQDTQLDSDEEEGNKHSLDSNADNNECSDEESCTKSRGELDEKDLLIIKLKKDHELLRRQLASATSTNRLIETPVSGKSYSHVSSTSSRSKSGSKNQPSKLYFGNKYEKLTMKDVKINEVNAEKLLAHAHFKGLSFVIPFSCVAIVDGQLMEVDLNQQARLFVTAMFIIKTIQYKSGDSGCVGEAVSKLCNPHGFPGIDGLVMPQEITLALRKNAVFTEYAKKAVENLIQRNKGKMLFFLIRINKLTLYCYRDFYNSHVW